MIRNLKLLAPLSIGLLFAGAMSPLPLRAQEKEAAKPTAYVFPKSVILALRGKIGDAYQFKSTTKSSTKMNVETQGDVVNSEDTSDKTYKFALLEKMPTGNFKFEIKLLTGIEANNADDGIRRSSLTPGTMIAYLKPNNEQEKLEFPPSPKIDAKSGKPTNQPELDDKQKKTLSELLESISFPATPLKVGDTWEFKPSKNTYNKDNPFANFSVKGTLAGFEMIGNTPCAKVEATIQPIGVAEEFEKNIKKNLPPDADLKGTTEMKAKATYFISLDRGVVLDIKGKAAIKLDYIVHAGGMDLKLKGDIILEKHSVTTTVPDFDPSLVESPK